MTSGKLQRYEGDDLRYDCELGEVDSGHAVLFGDETDQLLLAKDSQLGQAATLVHCQADLKWGLPGVRHRRPGVRRPPRTIVTIPASTEAYSQIHTISVVDLRNGGNVLPLPTLDFNRVRLSSQEEILVIRVYPANLPPVRSRGRIFVRKGRCTTLANESEERALLERQAYAEQR